MFLLSDKTRILSGYILLNEILQIEEFSGQINLILRREHLDLDSNLNEIIKSLKKKVKHFFKSEIQPALKSKIITHLSFERKKSVLTVSVTPLNNGKTLLSFLENPIQKLQAENTLELLNQVFLEINSNFQITHLCNNFQKLIDVNPPDVLDKNLEEIHLFGEQSPAIMELVRNTFQSGEKQSLDMTFPFSEERWWNVSTLPHQNTANNQSSVLIIFQEITERKLIEQKYLESEKRYEMAMEAADLGVWDFAVSTGKTYYSRKWKSILGYYPDEIADDFSIWEDLLHPEDKDRMQLFINNFLQSDLRIYEAEFRMKHKNGQYIWIRSRATALRDESGKTIRMLGTHRDITEEKKSESEFKKLYQAIMQSPISVIITNTEGYIEFFNPAFCRTTGWNDMEILGKKTSILKSGFHNEAFYEKLWKTIKSGNEWQGEFKNRKKNGELYWELASISPLKNAFGTITHYVKIAENISYLKKIERDLKKAKQEAELANTYKNNFIANMSHEIRTPINTIIGFSELLKHETLSQQKRNKYSEIIEENSQSLLRLIDDIIDISKIEANELKIKKEACSLGELFSELELTYNNFLKRREKANISLSFHIPGQAHHDIIFTDPQRLRQIINNLFINALRSTDVGQIEIGYDITNDNKVQLFVSDTGEGISASQLKNIFRRNALSSELTNQKFSEPLLGLSISKELAILLGGDISVKSVVGEGSVFLLTIPYDKIKIPMVRTTINPERPPKYNFKDFTIMIAEDTLYNYEYLQSILSKAGANVVWAKDGIDVLKLFNSSKIDLILMDIQLPEIDGFEATVQIRKQDKDVPIIAQTAYAMAEDRQKCLESGCNDVLTKPIRIDDVLSTVSKYLKK